MSNSKPRVWLICAALVLCLSGGAALLLLDTRCVAEGGVFRWLSASCERSGSPVILQGDIHRV